MGIQARVCLLDEADCLRRNEDNGALLQGEMIVAIEKEIATGLKFRTRSNKEV